MHLKTLTLRGFKSFASATTLHFEPGITCVVGPNGSGKSNVVDALSWVMGEQGAKSLRGGKMEDVIFAGTSGRPPLGRAEVVLTIDNTDGALPIEYAEVTIARTMFRNGGSDYAINGAPARLLDVQELLSDSGIGREMHVIVGQGQLDAILQATPEIRRGFVEEAAGVLKHRRRKERALRKLDACDANLTRLADLITEIRRQLKPLGRQAEVARKAAVIQAELRDASARLLADDLVQALLSREGDLAEQRATAVRRAQLEESLSVARLAEQTAEEAGAVAGPALLRAQQNWLALAALRERVAGTRTIATDRLRRSGEDTAPVRPGRDPEQLADDAAQAEVEEARLRAEVDHRAAALREATELRTRAEADHRIEEERVAAELRAAADRRETLARLTGQIAARRSRAEAEQTEIDRLSQAREEARARAARAGRQFAAVEVTVAGLDAGEVDLDAEHEAAVAALETAESALNAWQQEERSLGQQRAAQQARVEGLEVGLVRRDAAAALCAAADSLPGVGRRLAAVLAVEPTYERAISAALGPAADAVLVTDSAAAGAALAFLRAGDHGRAWLVQESAAAALPRAGRTRAPGEPAEALPGGPGRWAADLVSAPVQLRDAVGRLLRGIVVVPDLEHAVDLVAARPDLTAVTVDGELLGDGFVAGGSRDLPSLLELQVAADAARDVLHDLEYRLDRHRFGRIEVQDRHDRARRSADAALAQLYASDAELSAVAEDLSRLSAAVRAAEEEAERLARAMEVAARSRDADLAALVELEQRRLDLQAGAASQLPGDVATGPAPRHPHPPDPRSRDRLAEAARLAREAETEQRLAVRTAEERLRAVTGRADALRRAAHQERLARLAEARRRAEQRARAEAAAAVHAGSVLVGRLVDRALQRAAAERDQADAVRSGVDQQVRGAREQVRRCSAELELLVDSAHVAELARAERLRTVEALQERALAELGMDPDALVADYGPDRAVPTAQVETDEQHPGAQGPGAEPAARPYVRPEQQRRQRDAERALAVLGRVNPLALEEFDALEERHRFLGEQLEDLRRTRRDLTGIIADVDARVEQVFAEAYGDVERAFGRVFARLFPGGEGRLVLTEPGDWLSTGIDVEARPAGKVVKRLSLLSGGERSLVAVAFLVSLFIARPSPFYILDEVEAALDDTNLGRLLEIYEELRGTSQLLVITHQMRTMEIADALYGVSMRGDGVSAVISQRLRTPALASA